MVEAFMVFCSIIFFCAIGIIVSIVRAYREKDKIYYINVVVGFLTSLTFFFFILNQRALAWILMASVFVVTVFSLPSLEKYNKRKMKEALTRVDLSAPLRLRNILTTKEWLKLAHRWGIGKALFVVWLCMMPIIGGVLFALNLWLKFVSIGFIISFTICYTTSSIGSLMLIYHAAKSALKEKPSEVLRVPAYRSLNVEDLYRKLLDVYTRVWGSRLGATRELENKIRSCVKQGLNREDAIRKIAAWEFEGIPWET